MTAYESPIALGYKYRDKITGFEGSAACVVFYAHYTRVCLSTVTGTGKLKHEYFDAVDLEPID